MSDSASPGVTNGERNIMKTYSTPLLASVIIAVIGSMSGAFAAHISPRQIEENPALVRPSAGMQQEKCKLCTIDANTAFRRSPRAIEENPELARTVTCSAEFPVKARGVSIATRTPSWPRILETR
jgi:hypothetical protein